MGHLAGGSAAAVDKFDGIKVADEIERVDIVRERNPWFFDKSISHADEDLYITKTAEAMDEETLAQARRQVGIRHTAELDNKRVLVVDFGSTFSKIGTFDTATEEFSLHYVPIIYAGNQDVRDYIEAIYNAEGVDIRLTPNVMPEINHFHIPDGPPIPEDTGPPPEP